MSTVGYKALANLGASAGSKTYGAMQRMVDPAQTHIWFEQCDSCRGSFFDAG